MALKEYKHGAAFPGTIGRVVNDSSPAWPEPNRARTGALVLFWIIDDVGYGQMSAFGGLVQTPNIDKLANNGLRYTNMHTTALCSPTRACMLTGRNQHSNGLAAITEFATGYPGYDGRMPFENGMLSEILLEFSRFSAADRTRIGVHTCPGGDRDSTHSADVDYAALLPSLFELMAGCFSVALAGEPDRGRVLEIIRERLKLGQIVFVGVSAEVCDRVLEAAEHMPLAQLGTCDDCGFSPFCDDTSSTRETAFATIRARDEGTALASARLQAI